MVLVQNEPKKIVMGQNVADMQGPCPTGFHVPTSVEWTAIKTAMTTLGIDTSNGNCCKTYLKMPFAGIRSRSNSSPGGVDSDGYYNSSILANSGSVIGTRINSSLFNTAGTFVPSGGMPIRPFKNTPSIPDNSWTTLYGTLSAGIFMKDGLISISSDGVNWITIADKNLGATTVYNDGDTLAESNCGGYFQWGNNYMFPFTGTVTTSSTKVDASNYGPGNYYSSSTFITVSASPYNWDSSNNDNLRGGVSGAAKEIKRVTIRPNGVEKQIRPVTSWDMSKRALAQTSNTLGSGFYTGVFCKQDGTKIFFTCASTQRIYECTLSTPFDISNLSLTKYISSAYPEDISFSPDGTKMFILKSDSSPYQIKRYTLSTAWDISTATNDQTITAGTANGDRGLYITPDGKTIYRSMAGQNTLHKATMSTAWDLTTASAWDSKSNYGGVAIWFGNDGKFFARKADGSQYLYWYELSTGYDLSVITSSGNKALGGNDYGLGLWYNDTGTIAFCANGNYHTITKYTL